MFVVKAELWKVIHNHHKPWRFVNVARISHSHSCLIVANLRYVRVVVKFSDEHLQQNLIKQLLTFTLIINISTLWNAWLFDAYVFANLKCFQATRKLIDAIKFSKWQFSSIKWEGKQHHEKLPPCHHAMRLPTNLSELSTFEMFLSHSMFYDECFSSHLSFIRRMIKILFRCVCNVIENSWVNFSFQPRSIAIYNAFVLIISSWIRDNAKKKFAMLCAIYRTRVKKKLNDAIENT